MQGDHPSPCLFLPPISLSYWLKRRNCIGTAKCNRNTFPMEKRSELGHGSCARAGAACRAREHKDATLQPPCKRLGGKILLLRSAASLAEARPDDGRGRGHWRGRDEGADRPGAMAAAVERRRKARRRPAAKLAIVSFIVTIIVAVAAAAAADGRAGARLVGSRKGGELAR